MIKKIQMMIVVMVAFLFLVSAADAGQTISVKGYAYRIEKPDIAFVIIKTSGKGNDYNASAVKTEENIAEIVSLAKRILKKNILPTTIKTVSKPLSAGLESYDGYEQDYFKKMAQAIKGEAPEKTKEKKETVYITEKYIYFSVNDYSINQLDEFKNALASKELAFNDKSTFDFISSFDLNKSYILFGTQNPYLYLENLTRIAYKNAKLKAQSTARAVNMTLGKIISIEKNCNDIEGNIDITALNKLLGKQIGPLSTDPAVLPLGYNLKFIFEIY